MNYVLYPLQFDTPIHFGCAENGGKLEQSSLTYRSDSLFGALCCELAACGNTAGLQRFHDGAANGSLVFSDLFPYISEEENGLQLYVPKPVLPLCRRSGFLTPDGSVMQKKNDVYMIGAGSCFPKKIKGTLVDVGGQISHPVWRYGKGLYAGLIL